MKDDVFQRIRSLPTAKPTAQLDRRIASLQPATAVPRARYAPLGLKRLAILCGVCIACGFVTGYAVSQSAGGAKPDVTSSGIVHPPDRHVAVILTRSIRPRPFDFAPRRGKTLFGGEIAVSTHVGTGEL